MKKKKITIPWLVICGFSFFLVLFIVAGSLGLYFLNRATSDTKRYIYAVDSAREAQVNFQKQFHLWKTIVLEGNNFETFKKNYHAFSFQSDRVQDLLFNLKLTCMGFQDIPGEITGLRELHREITGEYIDHIVRLKESGFRDRQSVISGSLGRDQLALNQMEKVVESIESFADREAEKVAGYYFILSLLSFIFVAGMALVMAVFLAREIITTQNKLEKRVNERTQELADMNRELEDEISERKQAEESLRKAMQDIEEANRIVSVSEERYRLLVEGSSDVVFTLDETGCFISANRAVKTMFKINPDDIMGLSFIDFAYSGQLEKKVNRELVREKFDSFIKLKTPVEFNAEFKAPLNIEPVEMTVRLQYITIEGKNEILGKAQKVTEDVLNRFVLAERKSYAIHNSLVTAEDLTHRATRGLVRYLDAREANLIRIAIREMVINAIEHGNLNITFEEKSRAMIEDTYFDFIAARRKDVKYRDKRVFFEYIIDSERAVFRITDEGPGFDHQKMLRENSDMVNKDMVAHGRGITMAKNIFDEVRYNRRGNQVLLVKRFRQEDPDTYSEVSSGS